MKCSGRSLVPISVVPQLDRQDQQLDTVFERSQVNHAVIKATAKVRGSDSFDAVASVSFLYLSDKICMPQGMILVTSLPFQAVPDLYRYPRDAKVVRYGLPLFPESPTTLRCPYHGIQFEVWKNPHTSPVNHLPSTITLPRNSLSTNLLTLQVNSSTLTRSNSQLFALEVAQNLARSSEGSTVLFTPHV